MFPIQNFGVECEVCLLESAIVCVFFCLFLCEIVDRFDFRRSRGRSVGSTRTHGEENL